MFEIQIMAKLWKIKQKSRKEIQYLEKNYDSCFYKFNIFMRCRNIIVEK